MPTFTPIHRDLTFLSPLSEARAARLVAFLAEDQPSTALDVGCGWGELLLRLLEASPATRGLGLDLDEEALGGARRHAVAPGAGRASDVRGPRRPRGRRHLRLGDLHRGLADLGAPHRRGAAAGLRRRPHRPAPAAPARWSARLRRGGLVGTPDTGCRRPAGGSGRRVRAPGHAGGAGRGARLRGAGRARGGPRRVGHLRVRLHGRATPAGWPSTSPTIRTRRRCGASRRASTRLTSGAIAGSSGWPTSSWSPCERRARPGSTSPSSTWRRPPSSPTSTTPPWTAYPCATTPPRRSSWSAATVTTRARTRASGSRTTTVASSAMRP